MMTLRPAEEEMLDSMSSCDCDMRAVPTRATQHRMSL